MSSAVRPGIELETELGAEDELEDEDEDELGDEGGGGGEGIGGVDRLGGREPPKLPGIEVASWGSDGNSPSVLLSGSNTVPNPPGSDVSGVPRGVVPEAVANTPLAPRHATALNARKRSLFMKFSKLFNFSPSNFDNTANKLGKSIP
jgi:hypothetical protein